MSPANSDGGTLLKRVLKTRISAYLIVSGAIAASGLVISSLPMLTAPATAQEFDDDFDDDFDGDFDDDFEDLDDGLDDDFDGFDALGDDDGFDDDFDIDDDGFDSETEELRDDDDDDDADDDLDDADDLDDDTTSGEAASREFEASTESTELDDSGFAFESGEILAFDVGPVELQLARDLGFEPIASRDLDSIDGRVVRLTIPESFTSTKQALTALNEMLPAAPFDYNYVYQLPERPAGSGERGSVYDQIGEPQAGVGIRIGIIDTLVDTSHPSLLGQSITVADFAADGGRDTVHATAIASILTGDDREAGYRGLLPGSEVFAANVFSIDELGRPTSNVYLMATALDWVASHDVGVINASIAGPPSDVLQAVLARLHSRGHLVVAAVGNEGPAAPPLYPSAYEDVAGVTAIDLDGQVYRRAGRGEHVDFAAPGVRVLAAEAGGSYGYFTGTSFATPVVSALISQRLTTRAERSLDEVLTTQTVRDLGEPGRDTTFGFGLILGAPTEDR